MKRYFYAFLLGLSGVAVGWMSWLGDAFLLWGLLLIIACPFLFLLRNPA